MFVITAEVGASDIGRGPGGGAGNIACSNRKAKQQIVEIIGSTGRRKKPVKKKTWNWKKNCWLESIRWREGLEPWLPIFSSGVN